MNDNENKDYNPSERPPVNPDAVPYTQGGYVHGAYGTQVIYGNYPSQPPGIQGQPGYTGAPYGGPGVYGGQPYTQQPYGQPAYGGAPPQPPKEKPEKPKKEKNPRKPLDISAAMLVIIIVVCCVASGVGGGFIGANVIGGAPVAQSTGEQTGNIVISPAGDEIAVTEAVAKKVLPSVVGITATGTIVSQDIFLGEYSRQFSGVGTGMIVDERGYILTNSHVILDDSVDNIKVLLSSGEETDGEVVWNDSSLDLAIVKIDASGLVPVELGDSDDVAIGSYVAAIGNPLGLAFNGSVTQGVVSGLNRSITVADDNGGNAVRMEDLIQVDAAINGGNSGGPLLNSRGQVIGVNTAKAQAEGMGFAIPINIAAPIVERVIATGSFERVYMGISAADVSLVRSSYPEIEIIADEGAVVVEVNPGSPAEKAGLKVKDVIISIDGKPVNGSSRLIKLLLSYDSGDVIEVGYLRDGNEQTTELHLISASELNKIQQEENPFKNPPADQNDGRMQNDWGYNPFSR